MAKRRGGTIGKSDKAQLPEGLHYVAYWPGDDPSLQHLLDKVESRVHAAVAETSRDAEQASAGQASIVLHPLGTRSPSAPPLAVVVTLTTEIPFLIEDGVYIRHTATGGALHEDILARLTRVAGHQVDADHDEFRRLLRPIYSSVASTEMVIHAGEQVPLFIILLQKPDAAAAEPPMMHRLPRATIFPLTVSGTEDGYDADDAVLDDLRARVQRFVASAHLSRPDLRDPAAIPPSPATAELEAELDRLADSDGPGYHRLVERVFRHCFPSFLLEREVAMPPRRMDLLLHVHSEAPAFFWRKMRERHDLTHLVIECKNYAEKLPADEAILAMEKYIVPAASKNLGLLVTRWGVDVECLRYLHKEWRDGRCFLPMDENDLRAMMRYRDEGCDPSLWLWQVYARFTKSVSNY